MWPHAMLSDSEYWAAGKNASPACARQRVPVLVRWAQLAIAIGHMQQRPFAESMAEQMRCAKSNRVLAKCKKQSDEREEGGTGHSDQVDQPACYRTGRSSAGIRLVGSPDLSAASCGKRDTVIAFLRSEALTKKGVTPTIISAWR